MAFDTFTELRDALVNSRLFTPKECEEITNCCGSPTMGNAVIACELLEIELCGDDIEIMFEER